MITVCEENMCVGCMACMEVCNKSAIEIKDTLKEFNAVIDENLCVNCGRCHRVCQNNNNVQLSKSIQWFQGWSKENREFSSSGGAAAEIVSIFIKHGGVVCSCAFKNGEFGFYFAPDEIQFSEYAGSKYVKSTPQGIYGKIKWFLNEDKKVLFLGLPCQVAALKGFVGNKYLNNLYTVDLICHGTPSPKLLDFFLKDYKLSLLKLGKISFRNKSEFKLWSDLRPLEPHGVQDNYSFAFLTGLDYTENCYYCRYARRERVSDITIGDSWGSEVSEEEKKKGVSLILCQTTKGIELVRQTNLHLLNVDYNKSVECNQQLIKPSTMPQERILFFKLIKKGFSFKYATALCYPKFYMCQKLKRLLIKVGG